jgi:type I site-specific restriction-modification system R (restriction) subunit
MRAMIYNPTLILMGRFTNWWAGIWRLKQVFRLVRESKTRIKTKTILDDIDFELELIHRDQINVAIYLEIVRQKKEKKELQQLHKEKPLLGGDINWSKRTDSNSLTRTCPS